MQITRDPAKKISNELYNRRNNLIFAIIIVPLQVIIVVMHSIYIKVDNGFSETPKFYAFIGFNLLLPFIMAFVILWGFALIFSYNHKLLFTGIGFSFFIFAFVIQFYPLVNAFWTKTKILFYSETGFNDRTYPFYLGPYSTQTPYYNTIQGAFRCALSVIVSFSCILGRVGSLQCLLTTILGVIGYQLNRQVCFQKFGDDAMGTMYIFSFGGFMGLTMGLLLKCRQKDQSHTDKHRNYTSNQKSAKFSYIGSLIIFFLLPFFGMGYKINSTINKFTFYTVPISILISLSASLLGAFSISIMIQSRVQIRTAIYGTIAGGITGGASAYFTQNVVYALVAGFVGGGLQAFIHSVFDKRALKQKGPIATISFSLFAVQGFLGCIFAAIYKVIIESNSNGLNYTNLDYESVKIFLFGVVSSLMGIGFGLLGAIIILLVNGYKRHDYFSDFTEWRMKNNQKGQKQEDGLGAHTYHITEEDRWSWDMVSIQY